MKISVVVPNYNHADKIGRCIEAILNQSYKNIELIIIDDGSTDYSREVIASYARDERVKTNFLERNTGVVAAQLVGIGHAKGDLYFGAAADDNLCDPDFFTAAVEMFSRRPSAAGVFARSRVIEMTDDSFLWVMGSAPREGFIDGQKVLDAFLQHQIFIPGSSVLLRLDLLKEIGGFPSELGPQADYYVNHALAAVHGVFFLDREVAAFRVAPTTYSGKTTDEEYFRNHALAEKRLKSFVSNRTFDPILLRYWRDGVIHGRFNLMRCAHFYDAVQTFAEGLLPSERRSTPQGMIEVANRALEELKPMKAHLDSQQAMALVLFNDIAGPLGNVGKNEVGLFGHVARFVRALKLP
jgi:glycosyltransferase involved in cell wall biosynthesis